MSDGDNQDDQQPLSTLPQYPSGANLYVGGLNYDVTEQTLTSMFAAYGNVANVKIVQNRFLSFSKQSS